MVSEILRGLGCHSVFACGDTKSALDTIRWQRVDLAIIDIALEGEDGVDFVRQLRASAVPGLAQLAILVVSAFTTEAKVIEAGAAGVDGFLSKPISVTALANRMSSAIVTRTRQTRRDLCL